ncbi:Ger(x)C family spore germination protein [Lederbergia wuyishanensis]|uniref:Ger(X)C family germination protein n=1 Tax=Lederbergia wuyishanensis TaxID=1347903 RepID=A0ABU0D8L3_9BACI|nr:Ger(x)C family spore germination protein [Lederbergia wuyishanensis]MCJ8007657.1 Ger(x)C family spore germination protein [Lederbergia wuyishanensis]MDQ0344759.1 Ger(x)C family germination protein [Lederbergia wuyishanensis]
MKYRFPLIWMIIFTSILAGCWDQRLLKDNSLILAIGYDQLDGKIMTTISHPISSQGGPNQSSPPRENELLSSSGDTARDAEVHMERKVPEKFDMSKVKVILLGKELASHGIFSILDSTYRDLRGPLNAKIAIIKQNAKDGLSLNVRESMTISDYYSELLHTSEQGGITKNENVQSIFPIILSEGKDFVVPYMTIEKKENKAKIIGLAMFDDDKFSGTLGLKESSMFLILSDSKKKNLPLNFKVSNKYKKEDKNYVSIQVLKIKRKIKIDDTGGNIKAKVIVDVKLSVEEYPQDNLFDKKKMKQLNNNVQKKLNTLAESTIKKMQTANCDALGIGQKVKAYHYKTWKTLDWKKTYPEIPIEVEFTSEFIQHGIIN